jgi:hypothetical protein
VSDDRPPPDGSEAPVPREGGAELNPYAGPQEPRLQWILVVVGVPVGFVAWVVGSFAVLAATGTLAGSTGGNTLAVVVLVLLLIGSVGLIVWRRTRRLAAGFVLGAAIGLVVAGGLCIPLVTSF